MEKLKTLLKFEIFSLIFSLVVGTLLHFTFEWSNYQAIVGAFSPVNESVWEHLKLVFYPILLTSLIGYFYFKRDFPNYLYAKTVGLIVALLFITIFFYTYSGIIGTNFAILDIGSFFVAIFLAEFVAYKKLFFTLSSHTSICFVILGVLLFSFIFFTYLPPHINYFRDPVTGSYGRIEKQ